MPRPSSLRALGALVIAGALLVAPACSKQSADATQNADASPAKAEPAGEPATLASAKQPVEIDEAALLEAGGVGYFAGGCFWGVEYFLEQIPGVLRVESGYMGGEVDEPSYEDVQSQTSGHLETVRVWFDPEQVDYRTIAKRFFEIHDPTQADGQGPDIGPEYLSAVFVTGDEQREVVDELIAELKKRGYDVVTQVRGAEEFWTAEEYHQDYYVKHEDKPYCHVPVDRFGDGD